jgi:hypothetical protein
MIAVLGVGVPMSIGFLISLISITLQGGNLWNVQ